MFTEQKVFFAGIMGTVIYYMTATLLKKRNKINDSLLPKIFSFSLIITFLYSKLTKIFHLSSFFLYHINLLLFKNRINVLNLILCKYFKFVSFFTWDVYLLLSKIVYDSLEKIVSCFSQQFSSIVELNDSHFLNNFKKPYYTQIVVRL